jgi:serine/alanine adding enzyme
MSMTVVRTLPYDKWRHFVDAQPAGNIFHTPEMYQVFERANGHRPELWATLNDGGEVVALFTPVRISVKEGPMRYLTTRAVTYGSVLAKPTPEGQEGLGRLLAAYRAESRRRATLFTELRHVSDVSVFRPVLEKNRFHHEEHLNYLIDLEQPLDAIWEQIAKPARKAVERAQRRGTTAEEVQDRTCVAQVHQLLQSTFSRAQVWLADRSLFEAAFDVLAPKGMVRMMLACGDGVYAATTVELQYKGVMFIWYFGWDREYHALYPNDALTWHSLQWGVQHGYRCFDWGGAGVPNKPYGPREFKSKYGGQLVNYGRATSVHRPLTLALSRAGYELYRKTL